MNVFVLDNDPVVAARFQCDKHVVKMVLESAQLLCSAHHMLMSDIPDRFYRLTHKNHPCSIWARSHPDNYNWLASHATGLLSEYTHRYGKTHKSTGIIEWCKGNPPLFTSAKQLPFAQAMPDQYKDDDPVVAYRNYYIEDKFTSIKMVWTKREMPNWMPQQIK